MIMRIGPLSLTIASVGTGNLLRVLSIRGRLKNPSKGLPSLLLLRPLDGQALYLVLLSGEAVTSKDKLILSVLFVVIRLVVTVLLNQASLGHKTWLPCSPSF